MNNHAIFKSLVILCSSLYFGIAQGINVSSDTISKAPKEQVILIQSAGSGTIAKDKSQKNLYNVTLKTVMPYLSYVSDRPNRNVGKISLEKYLELWLPRGQNSFKNSPPNAIIHASTENNSDHPQYFALEISEPKYDKNSDTLVYQGKPLVGDGSNLPDEINFSHITLIIDDVCIGCWN